VTGNRRAFDLAAALAAQAITLRQVEAYRMVAAQSLPDAVARDLAAGTIDTVILMSPETARAWTGAVGRLPVKPDLRKVVHLTLSAAVAKTLGPDPSLKIEIASAPNVEQMLALTFHLAAKSKPE
jgi:uroporphyrinogen-III synthase